MFKLSKESRITFFALLIVPLVWIALSHLGYLDYLKTKSVDWRMQWPRGEISHRDVSFADEPVTVENNQTVPRVPKVTYVNFDAGTLAMEGVGERPWDRAFFRDVARVLLERGKARVVAFDFGFTPKSVSRMVPKENVYRSDSAIGELVADYPERVVLGALYSGVPTQFVKKTGANAYPPFFKDGFIESPFDLDGKHHYPESPTYPLQSYKNDNYVGRIGSFTVPPYRSVDDMPSWVPLWLQAVPSVDHMPRWVPLWFPVGGKAHAYNVLGGKQDKLLFDLQKENADEIVELQADLESLATDLEITQKELENPVAAQTSLKIEKSTIEQSLADLQGELETTLKGKPAAKPNPFSPNPEVIEKLKAQIAEADVVIVNLQNSLKVNPAIAAVLEPQLKARAAERAELSAKLVELQEGEDSPEKKGLSVEDLAEIAKLKKQIEELEGVIGNLQNSLKANPAIAAVLEPQLKAREAEMTELSAKLVELQEGEDSPEKKGSSAEDLPEIAKLKKQIEELDEAIANFRNSLKVVKESNPGAAVVVEQQLKAREVQKADLVTKLVELQGGEIVVDEGRVIELRSRVAQTEQALATLNTKLSAMAVQIKGGRAKFEEAEAVKHAKEKRLGFLQASSGDTELLEVDDRLRLVYKRSNESEGNGTLVDSLPNEMPLYRGWRCYALGLEALLAYYGVSDEAVTISEDKKNLRIMGRDGKVELVNAPMSDGQFTEVNWFSKWGLSIPEVKALREAKKLYAEEKYEEYAALAPGIIRGTLGRVKAIEVPKEDANLLKALADLGVEQEYVVVADQLLKAAKGELDAEKAPSYNALEDLYSTIRYYFLPVGLESSYNPMCGMKDVLDYNRFHGLASENIKAIENKIAELKGPEYLEKLERALEKYPDDEKLQSQRVQVLEFIQANQGEAKSWKGQLSLINAFFEKFENSIVFIGPEEATFQDLAPTPFDSSSVPKVSTHGNLVKTLTSGFYLKRLPDWLDLVITLGFCVIMAFLAVYQGPKSSWVQAGGVVVQIGYVLIAFTVFSETHVIWPVATPTCAGLSTSFLGVVVMLVLEQKAKGRLKGMFGSYVSADLVEQMVESGEEPSLGGEETRITAYFSDVQAFSSFSELLSPTGLVDLMNEYLTAMTNILQEERGTLDKYIGDAIVAMYGAPIPMDDHAYQSVRTALLMQERQLELREKWKSEGDKWPDIVSQMQTRIGCNTGTATVGNMGALDRFNYTMMGDMVNLAARCESGAKAYGAYIMVTEETKDESVMTKDDIAFRYLDKIVVKGRKQPVSMFEPTGFMADLSQETLDCLDYFQQGIDKYLLQDWDGAKEMFEKSKELEPYKIGITPGVKDNPSSMLIERCLAMKWSPPGDDWDGVFVMTSK